MRELFEIIMASRTAHATRLCAEDLRAALTAVEDPTLRELLTEKVAHLEGVDSEPLCALLVT